MDLIVTLLKMNESDIKCEKIDNSSCFQDKGLVEMVVNEEIDTKDTVFDTQTLWQPKADKFSGLSVHINPGEGEEESTHAFRIHRPIKPVDNHCIDSRLQSDHTVSVPELGNDQISEFCDNKNISTNGIGTSAEYKNNHIENFLKEQKQLHCDICQKSFNTEKELEEHVLLHTEARPFHCDIRDKECHDKYMLKRHIGTHDKKKQFECVESFRAVHFEETRKDVSINNMGRPTSQDSYCGGSSSEIHEFQCDICKKIFISMGKFDDHLKKSHKKNKFCDICGKEFAKQYLLSKHIATHTGEKQFKCGECNEEFIHNYDLKIHLRRHVGEVPFQCSVCHGDFKTKATLSIHMRTHTGEKPFQCNICGQSFRHGSSLHKHMTVHTGEKAFKCDICDKSFTRKTHLNRHIKTHLEERPFQCDICEKSFYRKDNLVLHIKIHTQEKQYKCDLCDKRFARSCYLTQHMRTHTKEKPFQCKTCGNLFGTKRALTLHLEQHLIGKKAFQCEVCNKAFSWPKSLLRHSRSHIKDGQDPKKME